MRCQPLGSLAVTAPSLTAGEAGEGGGTAGLSHLTMPLWSLGCKLLELRSPGIVLGIQSVHYKRCPRCKALHNLPAFSHFNPSHLFFLTS